MEPVRVVAGGDQQLGGGVWTDAGVRKEFGRGLGDQGVDVGLDLGQFSAQGCRSSGQPAQAELGGLARIVQLVWVWS